MTDLEASPLSPSLHHSRYLRLCSVYRQGLRNRSARYKARNERTTVLARVAAPCFTSLPDLAHAEIASFLSTWDLLAVATASTWAYGCYRSYVRRLVLRRWVGDDGEEEEEGDNSGDDDTARGPYHPESHGAYDDEEEEEDDEEDYLDQESDEVPWWGWIFALLSGGFVQLLLSTIVFILRWLLRPLLVWTWGNRGEKKSRGPPLLFSGMRNLKKVVLRDDDSADAFIQSLKAGNGRSVEYLELGTQLTDALSPRVGVLHRDVIRRMNLDAMLPQLRALTLGPEVTGGVRALATLLGRGCLPQLENLDVAPCSTQRLHCLTSAFQLRSSSPRCAKLRLLRIGFSKGVNAYDPSRGEALRKWLLSGSCAELQELDLGNLHIVEEMNAAAGYVARATSLRTLHMQVRHGRSDLSFDAVVRALITGAPGLRHLKLESGRLDQAVYALAEAICSGVWRRLVSLDLRRIYACLEPVLRAIRTAESECADLVQLKVVSCLSVGVGRILWAGRSSEDTSSTLSALRTLSIHGTVPQCLSMMAAVCRSQNNATPRLRTLEMRSLPGEFMDLQPFLDAARTGALKKVRDLDLGWFKSGDTALAAVASYLREGLLGEHLSRLSLCFQRLSEAGVASLCGALREGACPRLRSLSLSNTDSGYTLGLTGVDSFCSLMACASALKHLHLSHIGLGSVGVRALGKALMASGAARLESFTCVEEMVDDDAVRALRSAFRVGAGVRLQRLSLSGVTYKGRKLLIACIEEGLLPSLVDTSVLCVDEEQARDLDERLRRQRARLRFGES